MMNGWSFLISTLYYLLQIIFLVNSKSIYISLSLSLHFLIDCMHPSSVDDVLAISGVYTDCRWNLIESHLVVVNFINNSYFWSVFPLQLLFDMIELFPIQVAFWCDIGLHILLTSYYSLLLHLESSSNGNTVFVVLLSCPAASPEHKCFS